MFRWRFTTDAQPRTKNGQPPHSTTGVASANCVQVIAAGDMTCCSGCPGRTSEIMKARIGSVSASETRKRRVMSSSSGLPSSSRLTVTGSSAMPHFGHAPGPIWRTSGSIGHVYSRVSAPAGAGVVGAGAGERNDSGAALNRSRQLSWQK